MAKSTSWAIQDILGFWDILGHLGSFGPFWAVLGHLGHFGPFVLLRGLGRWAIFGHLDKLVHFGQILDHLVLRHFGSLGLFWAFGLLLALLCHFGPFGSFG